MRRAVEPSLIHAMLLALAAAGAAQGTQGPAERLAASAGTSLGLPGLHGRPVSLRPGAGSRWLFATGAPVALLAQPAIEPEPQATTGGAPTARPIRFSFKEAPLDQVIDFFASETGLPVIRETETPPGNVTFISADEYPLDEALRILNIILQTRGVMLRLDDRFLYLQKLENMKAEAVPTFPDGKVPDGVHDDTIISVVLPLNNVMAQRAAEQLAPLVAPYGAIVPMVEQNALVLTETAAQCRRIASIIDTLDAKPLFEESVKLFPLKHLKADAALASLKVLVAEKQTTVVFDGQGNRRVISEDNLAGVRMEADARTNSIIVIGPVGRLGTIEQLINLLDVPGDAGAGLTRELATFALRMTEPEEAARQVRALFADTRKEDQPTVVALNSAAKVSVLGTPRQVAQASTLVGEMEGVAGAPGTDNSADRGNIAAIVPVKHVRAQSAADLLTRLLTSAQLRTVKFTALGDQRAVAVTGRASDVALVRELIASIDVPTGSAEVRLIPLDERTTGVTVERALALLRESGDEQGQSVRASIDEESRTAAVFGPAEAVGRIIELVQSIQGAAPQSRQVRLVELQHATAQSVVEFLRDLSASAAPFAQAGATTPVFEAIEASNTLMVAAEPAQHEIIAALARSVDVPGDSTPGPVRILRLRNADAPSVADVLTQTYALRTAKERSAKPVTVRADALTNTLMVSAHADVMPEIERIVDELNKADAADAEGREIRIFPLRNAAAEDLARTLDAMFPTPPAPVDRFGRPQPHLQQPKEVVVRAEPRTNSIIVDAPANRMEGFEALVNQLDTARARADSEIRTYRIERAEITVVADTLRRLADSGGLGAAEDVGSSPVVIETEPTSRTLVVSGPVTVFERVEQVLAELDSGLPPLETRAQFFNFTHASAEKVAPFLQRLLTLRVRDLLATRGAPSGDADVAKVLDVSADRGANALVVTAPEELDAFVRELVARLDSESSAQSRDVIRILPLASAKATEAAQALRTAIDSAGVPSGGEVVISAAESSNALVVSGQERDIEFVRMLIEPLDRAGAPDQTGARTIALKHARAERIAPLVERLLVEEQEEVPWWSSRAGDSSDEPTVKVAADARTNSVVITGPARTLAVAEQIVAQLDAPLAGGAPDDPAAGRPIRVLTLANADANEVLTNVQALFDEQDLGGAEPVILRTDSASNSIIARGTPDQLEEVETLVKRIDSASLTGSRQVRTIPIDRSRTSAAAVARVLQQMLEDSDSGLKVQVIDSSALRTDEKPQPKPEQPADPQQGGEADESSHAPGAEPAQELARRGPLVPRRIRLIIHYVQTVLAAAPQQQPGNASDAEPSEPDVMIAVDERTGALIVVGSARATERIAALAQEIQLRMPADPGRVRIISLPDGVDAERIAAIVRTTVNEIGRLSEQNPGGLTGRVGVIADTQGGAVVVSANDTDFAVIGEIIGNLAAPVAGRNIGVRVYPLASVSADRAATAVRDMLTPQPSGEQARRFRATRSLEFALTGPDGQVRTATIEPGDIRVTAGPAGTSLIVSGPPQALGLVDSFVALIDQSPLEGLAMIRQYELQNARAVAASGVLQEAFEAMSSGMQGPATLTPRFVPDERTNSLMVTATREQHDEVERLLTDLDGPASVAAGEFRSIPLTHVAASDIASTIRTLMNRRRDAGGEPSPSITTSDNDDALLVAASGPQLAEIERIVKELDVDSRKDRRTEFVALRYAKAEQVREALRVFYGRFAPEADGPGARSVTLVADPASNSLVISAVESEWPGIRSLIEKLDSEQYDTSRRLEVIALKHADAASVAQALQEAFSAPLRAELERARQRRAEEAARRGSRLPDALLTEAPALLVDSEEVTSVSADTVSNALVVSAGKRDMERIKAVVALLDVPGYADLPAPRVVPVKGGKASELARALNQIYAPDERGRRTPRRSLSIVGDDSSGVLIVRATDEEFAQVAALADAIQAQADLTRVAVRTLRLREQSAARLRDTIGGTFWTMAEQEGTFLSVQADRRSNTLVIASSRAVFDAIETLVNELDPAPEGGDDDGSALPAGLPGQELLVLDLNNSTPDDVREALNEMGLTREPPEDRAGVVGEPISVVSLRSRRAVAVMCAPGDARTVTEIVRALDAEPTLAEQETAIVPLTTADAAQVAETVRTLVDGSSNDVRTRLAESLGEQVRRLNVRGSDPGAPGAKIDLTVPVRISAEPQTNAIILSSSAANIEALRELVRMLDRLPVGDAVVVRIFHLNNASATRLAGVIRDLFERGDELRRLPGTGVLTEPESAVGEALVGTVGVSVDERTNALIVTGREEAVALAEVLVNQLDSDDSAGWVEPRVIALKFADARVLAELLNEVVVRGSTERAGAEGLQRQLGRLRVLKQGGDVAPGGPAVESGLFLPMRQVVIRAEETLNALVVIGSPENLALIQEMTALLDVEGASRANTVRVYPMKHAAADRVAELVRGIFRGRREAGAIRREDDLVVVADTRSNTLVVSTSASSFAVLESMLESLDSDGVTATIGLHVLPVGPNADARALASKIEGLMRERITAQNRGGAARDMVSIQADEASNSLIVAASDENLALIRDLVATLASAGIGGDDAVEVIALRSAKAREMADLVNELYVREQERTRGAGAVRVRAEERVNAIVVSGLESDAAAVRKLVARLDSADAAGVREIKIIDLRSSNALEMVNLLENVLAGRPLGGDRAAAARQSTLLRFAQTRVAGALGTEPTETEVSAFIREQVTMTPDLRTNSVVVSAPAPMMLLIETLVKDLEASAQGARTLEVFELVNADAEQTAELLRDLFQLRQQGNLYVLVPSAGPAAETNQAGEAMQNLGLGDMTLTVVPDERQQLAITVDPRTNSLLVSGTAQYIDLVREVVTGLDSKTGTERQQITYELKNARVDEVAQALQAFVNQEQQREAQLLGPDRAGSVLRRLEREVSVVGVPGSSRLILSASPRYMDKVMELVQELDRPPAQVVIQVLLAEVTIDADDTWGVDFTLGPIGSRDLTASTRSAGAGVLSAVGIPNLAVSTVDFDLLIRALQVQGRLEVLSQPKILVNDNEDARIQVGEEIRILSSVDRNDSSTFTDVEARDIGVILAVTPSISSDGYVRLDVAPEISALTTRTIQVSEDFSTPVISQRKADTTVTVRDGQTVVIGGLMQTEAETRKTKVPLLGDIPILGIPFQSSITRNRKTELLIALTPRVITNDRDLKGMTPEEIENSTTLSPEAKELLRGAIRDLQSEHITEDKPLKLEAPPEGPEDPSFSPLP